MTVRKTASSFVLFATLLGGCEVVPIEPQPAPAPAPYPPVVYPTQPPPNYVYEDIRRCRADNQRAHAEVLDNYERARQAGRINPSEAQQFAAMDARLRNIRGQLARDGLTLNECQYISGEIARMRDEVYRMARFDPALGRCMADNRRAHQEVVGLYQNARQSGRINPREAQRFNAIEGRLQNMKNDLARDGMSLQDCQRIAGAIAYERDEVTRMSRYVSPLTQCVADNRRAHEDVYIVYNEAQRAGRIDAREAQQFAIIDKRLRNFQAAIQRDGMTLNECQRVGQAIAQERAVVDRMAQY
jgi:uncharacterized metal-binding protein YceD (DUF177 family)